MKSLNVVFTQKEEIQLVEEEVSPLGSDEVLCRAEKSLISTGTELRCLKGVFDQGSNWDKWVQYPFNPGYSTAGEIIEVGSNVEGYKAGDRVFTYTPHCQYYKADQKILRPVPEGITMEEASWVSIACITQVGVRRAKHRLGESAGVVGLGLLGQLVVQYLKLMGARNIIAIDTIEDRLDMAKANGATHGLNININNAGEKINEITKGRMLDVIYDITGHHAVLASCVQLLRPFGNVILLGDTTTPNLQCLGQGVVSNSIGILGIHASGHPKHFSPENPWTHEEMTKLFFDYLLQKRMNVKNLITHTHSPLEAPEVYKKLISQKENIMGVVFDWNLV